MRTRGQTCSSRSLRPVIVNRMQTIFNEVKVESETISPQSRRTGCCGERVSCSALGAPAGLAAPTRGSTGRRAHSPRPSHHSHPGVSRSSLLGVMMPSQLRPWPDPVPDTGWMFSYNLRSYPLGKIQQICFFEELSGVPRYREANVFCALYC